MHNCQFCDKFETRWKQFFIVNRALHFKYSSNTNYYSTNEVNRLVSERNCPESIAFKAQIDFEDEDEFLKEYYKVDAGKERLKKFLEFYKFHQEIPRFFMENLADNIMKYHTSKRQLHYNSVKKMLNLSPSKPSRKNKIPNILYDKILETRLKIQDKSVSHTLEDIVADIIPKNRKTVQKKKDYSSTSKTKSNTRTLNLDITMNLNEALEISKFKKFLNNVIQDKETKAKVINTKNLKSISTLKGKKFSIRETRKIPHSKPDIHTSATFSKPLNSMEIKPNLRVVKGRPTSKMAATSKRRTEGSENFPSTDFRISSSQLNIRHSRLKSQSSCYNEFNSTKRLRYGTQFSSKNLKDVSHQAKLQLAHNKVIYDKIKSQLFTKK